MKRVLLFFSILLSIKATPRVVAIGLDGVNEEDGIKSKLLGFGKYYTYWFGKKDGCEVEKTGNITLPAFANFLTGTTEHNVKINEFDDDIDRGTLFDLYDGQLFSSWKPITYIVGKSNKNVYISYTEIFPWNGEDNQVLKLFKRNYNWSRFSLIHFVDADNFAHLKFYKRYRNAIDFEVNAVGEVIQHVGEDTIVIVFTDHSRGADKNWHSHGPWLKESRYIWTVIYSKKMLDLSKFKCGHIELHHLIKSILGN